MSEQITVDEAAKNSGRIANLRPWPKGVSGNPGGRPKKMQTVAELAEDSSEKAMATLIKLMGSDKDQVALAAAQAVLDRSMGKPKAAVEISGDEERPLVMQVLTGVPRHEPAQQEAEPKNGDAQPN